MIYAFDVLDFDELFLILFVSISISASKLRYSQEMGGAIVDKKSCYLSEHFGHFLMSFA
jgi:hypothetical protein